MRTLKLALAAQCLFFALWGGRLLASGRGGEEIWLKTVPVDPRDLISGHYVALRYDINEPSAEGCAELHARPEGSAVFVELGPSSSTERAAGREVRVWEAKACRLAPQGFEGAWVKGVLRRASWRAPSIEFGIERFYVTEDSPLRQASRGQVLARTSLRRERLRLRDIVLPEGP